MTSFPVIIATRTVTHDIASCSDFNTKATNSTNFILNRDTHNTVLFKLRHTNEHAQLLRGQTVSRKVIPTSFRLNIATKLHTTLFRVSDDVIQSDVHHF
jgi:hypothetical protein